jgi:hypothetical protein
LLSLSSWLLSLAGHFRTARQSTPLFSRGGELLGVVSTLFAAPHESTPIEMDALKNCSIIETTYLRELRGAEKLAVKAERIHERLYMTRMSERMIAANWKSRKLTGDHEPR